MSIKDMAKRFVAKKSLAENVRLKKKRKAEIARHASNFINNFNNKLFGEDNRPNIDNFLEKHAEEVSKRSVFQVSLRLRQDMTDFLKFDHSGCDGIRMRGSEQHQLITKYLSKLNKIFDTSVYLSFGTDYETRSTYYGEGRSSSNTYYYPTIFLNIPLK